MEICILDIERMDKEAKLKNKTILKIFKLFNNDKISNSDRDKEIKQDKKQNMYN